MQYFCTRILLYINNLRIFSVSNQPLKNETQKSALNIYVPSAPKETPIPFFFAFICNKETIPNFEQWSCLTAKFLSSDSIVLH